MEEKFSVSLELMIQKFKDKAKQVQDVSKNVANKIKENMTVNVGGGAFKQMSAESENLLNKINDIKATLTMAKTDNKLFSKSEILEMRVELEKLENQYAKLNQKGNMFSASFNNIQKGMDKSMKKAKRFTLSLFGIHSVYRMLSRASSSYLAQDEETSKKIQSAWIGLGSVFAPLLEKIANFTIKAVKYINVFIKALTGTDFLANAMAKSMNKASKSAGKLSKVLAGFDEITNLDADTGGATIDTSWINSFKDVELDPTLVEKITALGTKVKEIWDKYFTPFFTFLKDNWDLVGKDIIGLAVLIGIAIDVATGNWLGLIFKFVGFVLLYWDEIKVGAQVLMEVIKTIFKTGFTMLVGMVTTPIELIKGIINSITSTVTGVIDGVKKIFNGLIKFITGVFKGNWKRAWEGIRDIFSGIFTVLGSIIKLPLNLIIDGLNAIVTGVNKIVVGGLNKLLKLGKLVGINITIPTIPKIPKLEVGTNYIPEDTMAQLHKGEAVIPKKFNSSEYFGSGNDETNSLLKELIDRVEQIEINPYTTIKDVGQASQNYRNQQSRIIGEELA